MSGVSGDSMWFPQEKGDTAKMWGSFGGKKGSINDMDEDNMGKLSGGKKAKMTHKMRKKM